MRYQRCYEKRRILLHENPQSEFQNGQTTTICRTSASTENKVHESYTIFAVESASTSSFTGMSFASATGLESVAASDPPGVSGFLRDEDFRRRYITAIPARKITKAMTPREIPALAPVLREDCRLPEIASSPIVLHRGPLNPVGQSQTKFCKLPLLVEIRHCPPFSQRMAQPSSQKSP